MDKKTYEEPTIAKVEFDFSDCIAASGCNKPSQNPDGSWSVMTN